MHLEYVSELKIEKDSYFPYYLVGDLSNNLYLISTDKTVTVFSSDYTKLSQWKFNEKEVTDLFNLTILEETFYLTDEGNRRILVYSNGELVDTINHPDFSWVRAVAIDPIYQYIYVADNSKINQLTYHGDLIQSFGDLWQPSHLMIDQSGNIIVVDTNNHQVKKFSSQGELIWAIGEEGSEHGQFVSPFGIAIDSKNNIYISDSGPIGNWTNNRIQVFDYNGNFLYQYGTKGTGPGQFDVTGSLVITQEKDDEFLHIVDIKNKRIQKLKINFSTEKSQR